MSEYQYRILAYTDYAEGHIINGIISADDLAAALIAARADARDQIQEHLRVLDVLSIDKISSTDYLPGIDEQMSVCDDPFTSAIIDGFEFEDIGEYTDAKEKC